MESPCLDCSSVKNFLFVITKYYDDHKTKTDFANLSQSNISLLFSPILCREYYLLTIYSEFCNARVAHSHHMNPDNSRHVMWTKLVFAKPINKSWISNLVPAHHSLLLHARLPLRNTSFVSDLISNH